MNNKNKVSSSPIKTRALKRKSQCPSYTKKNTSLIGKYQHSIVIIYNNRIRSFSKVKIKNDCSFIDLSSNYLINFNNFPSSLLYLTNLTLDNNQIQSFQGIQNLNSFPKLTFLSLRKNPIEQNFYFKIMCLIVFGNQLHTINSENILDNQRQIANKMRKSVFPELIKGKIITNLNPIQFSSEKTIDLNDTKNSPKTKIDSQNESPIKSHSSSNLEQQNYCDGSHSVDIEKVDPKSQENEKSDTDKKDDNNTKNSQSSQLNAIVEMKSKTFNRNVSNIEKSIKDNIEKQKCNNIISSNIDDETNINIIKITKFNESENGNFETKEDKKIELDFQVINKKNDKISNLFYFSSVKIIEEPSINTEAELGMDYPESYNFLILDGI